jgi:hypothetical protein
MNKLTTFYLNLLSISLASTMAIHGMDAKSSNENDAYMVEQFHFTLSENINYVNFNFPGTNGKDPVIGSKSNDQDARPLPFNYRVTRNNTSIRNRGWQPLAKQDLGITICAKGVRRSIDVNKENIFDALKDDKNPYGTYLMEIDVEYKDTPTIGISYSKPHHPPVDF